MDNRKYLCAHCYCFAAGQCYLQCISFNSCRYPDCRFFQRLSSLVERKTGWSENLSLVLSIVITFLVIIALSWLIGARVQQQVSELTETLPSTIENAENYLKKSPLGQKLLDNLSTANTEKQTRSLATNFFRSTFGVFGDLYVVLFMGLFFTVSPMIYKKGIVQLIPKAGQSKGESLLNNLRDSLSKWLKGTLFSMFVVFAFTATGLAIIGIDMWLTLALIAGLLIFIPNLGPIIALIPAVLIGLMNSPGTAALVAGLYILIQVVESNFITPMIQQKLLSTPPALILIAQLFMTALTGGWGLVLATPLLVILMVVIKELYVKQNNPESDL